MNIAQTFYEGTRARWALRLAVSQACGGAAFGGLPAELFSIHALTSLMKANVIRNVQSATNIDAQTVT